MKPATILLFALFVVALITSMWAFGSKEQPAGISPVPPPVGREADRPGQVKVELSQPPVPEVSKQEPSSGPQDRREAAVVDAPVDWDREAADFLATTRANGDVGVQSILTGLQRLLDGTDPLAKGDPFAASVPSVSDLENSPAINPLGKKLTEADRGQLASLLEEFSARMRRDKRNQHIATQVSLAEAMASGDYVQKPNGSDPDGIWRKVMDESAGDFSNPRDQNMSEVPGRDFSHNRVIVLRPARYPRYVRALQEQRTTEAEFQVSIRMFFLPARSR